MKRRTIVSLISLVILIIAAATAYKLSVKNNPAATPQPSVSVTTSPAKSASPSATLSWPTADISIDSVLKSGTARVIAIRTGTHPENGYDRISIDFQGQAPGVKARYVNKVVQDGSGADVSLAGGAYLQLTFSPAAAHDESGTPSDGVPRTVQTTGYPSLKSYILNGDFEGVVSVALGQSSKAGFKINRADHGGVSTIYIDVPHL